MPASGLCASNSLTSKLRSRVTKRGCLSEKEMYIEKGSKLTYKALTWSLSAATYAPWPLLFTRVGETVSDIRKSFRILSMICNYDLTKLGLMVLRQWTWF
jgi:hypothetical protein